MQENAVDNEMAELPVRSLPADFVLTLNGWTSDDEAEAQEFAKKLLGLVQIFSEQTDLSTLESVVVTTDYHRYLDGLETGIEKHDIQPTNNEHGKGAAMAVPLNRDGKLRGSVVISTFLVRDVFSEDPQQRGWALHTLRHELEHVSDNALRDARSPGGAFFTRCDDNRQQNLLPAINTFTSEFRADFASAYYAPDLGDGKVDMLGRAMREFVEFLPARRLTYMLFDGLDKFWNDVERKLSFLFQSLGYALGFTQGIEQWGQDQETAARLRRDLDALKNIEVGWLIDACEAEIDTYYEEDAFTTVATFNGMIAIAEKLLNQFDVYTGLVEERFFVSTKPLTR